MADLDHSVGIISSTYMKDVQDPQWSSDAGLKKYLGFMSRYMPGANAADIFNVSGYLAAQALVHVLQECSDDLSKRKCDEAGDAHFQLGIGYVAARDQT